MAHSNWLYQTRDIMFQIKEWLGVEKLLRLDAYKEYADEVTLMKALEGRREI